MIHREKQCVGFTHTWGSAVSTISGIHWGAWNGRPADEGALPYFTEEQTGPREVKKLCRGHTVCLGCLCPEVLTSTLQESPINSVDCSLHLLSGQGCESLTALMSSLEARK